MPERHPHHHHSHGHSFDVTSREGTRAVRISLIGLLLTAGVQAAVVFATGSIGLLADVVHNTTDALTAIPIGLALLLGRRPPTDRFTYGFGRAEDVAGLAVVAVIGVSVVATAAVSITRLIHPRSVTHLGALAAAGAVGFLGNELVARYRIRAGRRIGSAALAADGHHARADGFASLAVVAGAIGAAVGWQRADPVVGLAISLGMAVVLVHPAREIFRRLMDSVDATTVRAIRRVAAQIEGVRAVDGVHVRWVGHQLRGELDLTVAPTLTVRDAHCIAENVHHALLHAVERLGPVTIHTDPAPELPGDDPHGLTAHHLDSVSHGELGPLTE